MTIRIGHDAQGHHSHALKPSRTALKPTPAKKPVFHKGITRQPDRQRTAPDLPINERQEAILKMVDIEDPISPREIAEVLGLGRGGVVSSLYALQDRGLVQRIPYKGWVKIQGGRPVAHPPGVHPESVPHSSPADRVPDPSQHHQEDAEDEQDDPDRHQDRELRH